MNNAITDCSVKRVFSMAFPLIASAFSWTLMLTCDRLMLANFDLNVMNAVVSLGTLLFLFEYSIVSITVTTEIFAGQYNGMNKLLMAPIATWQMLIFSACSLILFLFAGFYLSKYIIPETYYNSAGNFFKITMCFLVFSPATAAINGFFIGIKKPKVILFNSLFANILNISLSYILIFGIKGNIEPRGAFGAGIATSIAIFTQFCIIFSVFLSSKYAATFGTRNYKWNKKIFLECLKIGIPSSLGLVTEMIGNYTLQMIIILLAPEYVSNHNIALNIFIFITFLLNGMNKAASGLAANIIGAGNLKSLSHLLKSCMQLHLLFTFLIFTLIFTYSQKIASLYTNDPKIIYYASLTLPWVAIHFFFDGIGWIISGILTAGGDTKFTMFVTTLIIWAFRVAPIFILLKLDVSHIAIGWMVTTLSSAIFAIIVYLRYRSMKWIKVQLS